MTRGDVLAEALAVVSNDRQNDYGTPESNFGRIASLWNGYLGDRCLGLEAHDVAVLLSLVKVARIATSPQKADNWIDLAGYAACGAEVAGAE